MAGQWVEPGGGVPMSAASGRMAVQWICHADRKPFEALSRRNGPAVPEPPS